MCMVGITYLYIDKNVAAYGHVEFVLLPHLYCLIGCLSMIAWTHASLGILYAYVLYLYLRLFNAVEHVSHGKEL